jgi:hypothetical protein
MMNDEQKTDRLHFIAHHSAFIISSLPGGHAGERLANYRVRVAVKF